MLCLSGSRQRCNGRSSLPFSPGPFGVCSACPSTPTTCPSYSNMPSPPSPRASPPLSSICPFPVPPPSWPYRTCLFPAASEFRSQLLHPSTYRCSFVRAVERHQLLLAVPTPLLLSTVCLKPALHRAAELHWQQHTGGGDLLALSSPPSVAPPTCMWTLCLSVSFVHACLRFNRAHLNEYLHRRGGPSAPSPYCQQPFCARLHRRPHESTEHVLLSCPAYNAARRGCSLALRQSHAWSLPVLLGALPGSPTRTQTQQLLSAAHSFLLHLSHVRRTLIPLLPELAPCCTATSSFPHRVSASGRRACVVYPGRNRHRSDRPGHRTTEHCHTG